jgi:hypothetical protein
MDERFMKNGSNTLGISKNIKIARKTRVTSIRNLNLSSTILDMGSIS